MSKEKYKPQTPDVMEAVFDAGYLIFDLVAGILFFAFSNGNDLFGPLRDIDFDPLRRRRLPSGAENYPSCAWK